jgi:predicted P-loop ATPase
MATTTKRVLKTADYRNIFASLNMSFAFNEVTRAVELNGEVITDSDWSRIFCNLRDRGARNENFITHEIKYLASLNSYHPIKQFLNQCGFDGNDYISELSNYFHADKYFALWLNRWLIAAVSRAISGTQCPVLVLDGPQNIGKSGFARWLCSPQAIKNYFTEGPINPDSKDCRVRATRRWIWEASEFGSTTRRADVEALKAFISTGEITERQPYGKQDETFPMLACFIGTINNGNAGFLADPTGSRRFLVTHIDEIDWHGYTSEIDPSKVWAQAYASFLSGDPYELTADEIKQSQENNEGYETPNALLAQLEMLYEIEKAPISFTPTYDIIEAIQNSGFHAGTTNALAKQLADTLAKLKIKKERQRVGGHPNPVMGYFGIRRLP